MTIRGCAKVLRPAQARQGRLRRPRQTVSMPRSTLAPTIAGFDRQSAGDISLVIVSGFPPRGISRPFPQRGGDAALALSASQRQIRYAKARGLRRIAPNLPRRQSDTSGAPLLLDRIRLE